MVSGNDLKAHQPQRLFSVFPKQIHFTFTVFVNVLFDRL